MPAIQTVSPDGSEVLSLADGVASDWWGDEWLLGGAAAAAMPEPYSAEPDRPGS